MIDYIEPLIEGLNDLISNPKMIIMWIIRLMLKVEKLTFQILSRVGNICHVLIVTNSHLAKHLNSFGQRIFCP